MPSNQNSPSNYHPSCQRGDGGDLSDRQRGDESGLVVRPLDKGADLAQSTKSGDLRILGVDPGFGRTGLGVIDIKGSKLIHVWHSCIETPADAPFTSRLQMVRNDLVESIRRFSPNVSAVEHLFFQSNVKTASNVGMARGVILLALADAGLDVVELTPNEIKQTVAGHGSADKKQIQFMVTRLLRLKETPKPDDAADALAIAIAGGLTYQTRQKTG